ncbi:hypothetical protein SBRY_70426 [Actinacidiphila bryophytorum]|uniref:Uncharacterized protein n=1 Tax=Actinacidiphila bryophytorum TaxID=1436133 RepID=A0A9W4MJZ9_9ACTN|nr:hypothetical protein SBRY_70426 [Actinacidiphila bryophytorum]
MTCTHRRREAPGRNPRDRCSGNSPHPAARRVAAFAGAPLCPLSEGAAHEIPCPERPARRRRRGSRTVRRLPPAGAGDTSRQQGRHGDALPVALRLGRQGLHRPARPGRLRLRGGLTGHREHPGRPVVDLLPAGQLQAAEPPRQRGVVRRHGQHLPRRRCEGRR